GAFLLAIHVRDGALGQELFNAASTVGAELLGALYPAVESNDTYRVGFLNRALNDDLGRHPSGTKEVAFDRGNAMLYGELVDFLTVNYRNDEFVVANDSLTRRRSKR